MKTINLKIATIVILLTSIQIPASLRTLQSDLPASGWSLYSPTKYPNRQDWLQSFIKDCKKFEPQNNRIPAHQQNQSTVRIATYNIHFWCHPFVHPGDHAKPELRYTAQDIDANFAHTMQAIKALNADVLCLQEVLLFDSEKIKTIFQQLGYQYQAYFHEDQWASSFGSMIVSKYPFVKVPFSKAFDSDKEQKVHRGFIKVRVQLPNNKQITVYTSHFDWSDETEGLRRAEVAEILYDIAQDEPGNYLVTGDFNAVRAQDYQYHVNDVLAWDWMNKENQKRTGLPSQTHALEQFAQRGFSDCFAAGKIKSPTFSVWNGTIVDFMFLNKGWDLSIDGCYIYYTSASDHLPVIMDLKVS